MATRTRSEFLSSLRPRTDQRDYVDHEDSDHAESDTEVNFIKIFKKKNNKTFYMNFYTVIGFRR